MLTNFAKTVDWKHKYDVKLWRHKQPTPNTNDHHMPLNESSTRKFSAYATECEHQDSYQNSNNTIILFVNSI